MKSSKRILFITSFYSGIRKSIESGHWNPTGMPALYKLMEGLKKAQVSFDCYFIDSGKDYSKSYSNDHFPNSNFHVIGIKKNKGKGILAKLISRFEYSGKLKKQILNLGIENYDLIYLDRGQIALRHLLRKKLSSKLFLRLHGVSELFQSFEFSSKYYYLNYSKVLGFKGKFDFILSSHDGTPVDQFLSKYCADNVPKEKWLNGVDIYKEEISREKNNVIKFLTVGRLEADKGIREVVDAFLALPSPLNDKWELTVLGGGSLLEELREKTKDSKNIDIKGTVEHHKMAALYVEHDTLISLNFLGNISNVILEGINYELALITLKEHPKTFHDIESNAFLENHALYVDRKHIESSLNEKLTQLIEGDVSVRDFQSATKNFLKPKLQSWDDRINNEIEILEKLIESER